MNQHGGTPGRYIKECIVASECSAIKIANYGSDGLWLFTDAAAAYPSMCRIFLMKAIEKSGIPDNVSFGVMSLLDRSYHWVKVDGSLFPGFTGTCGVPTGSPMASALFCIGLDVFGRYIECRFGSEVFLRCYLDDMNIVRRALVRRPWLCVCHCRSSGSTRSWTVSDAGCWSPLL